MPPASARAAGDASGSGSDRHLDGDAVEAAAAGRGVRRELRGVAAGGEVIGARRRRQHEPARQQVGEPRRRTAQPLSGGDDEDPRLPRAAEHPLEALDELVRVVVRQSGGQQCRGRR